MQPEQLYTFVLQFWTVIFFVSLYFSKLASAVIVTVTTSANNLVSKTNKFVVNWVLIYTPLYLYIQLQYVAEERIQQLWIST